MFEIGDKVKLINNYNIHVTTGMIGEVVSVFCTGKTVGVKFDKPFKEENKMDFNYRGKEFNDPVEYANYILKCAEEDKAKIEKEKQEKLKAEKAKRIEELDKARVEYFETCTEAKEKYLKIVEQYNKDYGVTTSCSYSNIYPSNYFQDIIDKMIYGK